MATCPISIGWETVTASYAKCYHCIRQPLKLVYQVKITDRSNSEDKLVIPIRIGRCSLHIHMRQNMQLSACKLFFLIHLQGFVIRTYKRMYARINMQGYAPYPLCVKPWRITHSSPRFQQGGVPEHLFARSNMHDNNMASNPIRHILSSSSDKIADHCTSF